MALAQMVINTIQAHRHDFPVEPPIPLREWPCITWVAMPALLMPVILLGRHLQRRHDADRGRRGRRRLRVPGGRCSGIATSRCSDTYTAVLNSARSTASIGMLIAGALVFNYVVTIEQIPVTVKGLLAGYDLSRDMFLFWVNVILLVLGCLLEGSTIILVILPIFIPTAQGARHRSRAFRRGRRVQHHDRPGHAALRAAAVHHHGDLGRAAAARSSAIRCRSSVAMIVALAIITFVPETVLWLPRLMGYKG